MYYCIFYYYLRYFPVFMSCVCQLYNKDYMMIMMMMMFETDATVSDIITRSPFVNAIRENITSSTKPEVHNVSPEEDQASIAGTKKFSKAQP